MRGLGSAPHHAQPRVARALGDTPVFTGLPGSGRQQEAPFLNLLSGPGLTGSSESHARAVSWDRRAAASLRQILVEGRVGPTFTRWHQGLRPAGPQQWKTNLSDTASHV